MRTDEDIRSYQDRVDALVSKLKGLGMEGITDEMVEKWVLRTVTKKFEPKVSIMEERKDPLSSEQVFDTLHHFESRINQEDEPSAKEAAFKSISKHEEAST